VAPNINQNCNEFYCTIEIRSAFKFYMRLV